MALIRHKDGFNRAARFSAAIETPSWGLGVKFYKWGVRLLLGYWHYCHLWPKRRHR